MEMITQLIVIAILVEALTEIVKSVFEDGKLQVPHILAIAIGLIVAFTVNLDLFEVVGLSPVIPFVGTIATGILISRGANAVHDLIDRLR